LNHTPDTSPLSFDTLLSHSNLLLLDFWAPSCAPCLAMFPVLEKVAADYPELTLLKVNVEEQPEPTERFAVRTLPTLVLLQQGEDIGRLTGVVGESQIIQLLSPFLVDHPDHVLQQAQAHRQQGDIESAVTLLAPALAQSPDKGALRAELIHCYLDRMALKQTTDKENLQTVEALLSVSDFSWLRDPQVQQASSRYQLLKSTGTALSEQNVFPEVDQLVADENYPGAADSLLIFLGREKSEGENKAHKEIIQQRLIQLIDTMPDRALANRHRRRLVAGMQS
jgi:thioredoxin